MLKNIYNIHKGETLSNNDFSQYLIDIINAGSLSIMLSIGHRTRMFDVMAEIPSPSTAEEIA